MNIVLGTLSRAIVWFCCVVIISKICCSIIRLQFHVLYELLTSLCTHYIQLIQKTGIFVVVVVVVSNTVFPVYMHTGNSLLT